jgi:hypothetical protein
MPRVYECRRGQELPDRAVSAAAGERSGAALMRDLSSRCGRRQAAVGLATSSRVDPGLVRVRTVASPLVSVDGCFDVRDARCGGPTRQEIESLLGRRAGFGGVGQQTLSWVAREREELER